MSLITKPFAWLMLVFIRFADSNYGLAIIIFALVVKIILLPFQMKSKKSMMRMSRLNPKMKELQEKYKGDQARYNAELQKFYKAQGVSPFSGCIWSLIPFPILIALYAVVRQPLTKLMELTAEQVTSLSEMFTNLGYAVTTTGRQAAYVELTLANLIHQHFDQAKALVSEVMDFNLGFLGLNLGAVPDWKFFTTTDWSDFHVWLPALGLFLIPFISAGLSYLSMKVSTEMNPQSDAAGGTGKTMMLMMPLMSVWICFVMPAAMGIYWICNSVFAIIQDIILTKRYTSILNKEDAEKLKLLEEKEAKIEAKRAETEALRAANATKLNENTSKKKLQAAQRAKEEERRAAEAAVKRAERRKALGLPDEVVLDSQVGTRRYARGRAFIEDRFTNPEGVSDAESLLAPDDLPSIDETAVDETPAVSEDAVLAEEALVETVEEEQTEDTDQEIDND